MIDAVGKTPEGYNGNKPRAYQLDGTPFTVRINYDGDSHPYVFIVSVVPTTQEQVRADLEKDIARAVKSKSKKLRAAHERGARTILLLDSDDYALVNPFILADAFGRVAAGGEVSMDGINEVYIQHRGGAT